MAIVRTVTAWCDDPTENGHGIGLRDDSTQPYLDLTEQGWEVRTEDDDIKTYCPRHSAKTQLEERRAARDRGDLLCILCVELGLGHDGDHIVPSKKEA
jgi:hypothetical protein